MNRVLIIPAAGAGSRLGAAIPKLMVPVNGRPMVDHLLDRYARVVDEVVLVLAPGATEMVRGHCASREMAVRYAVQTEPTGMLDAILVPRTLLEEQRPMTVWITWCDQVAVMPETIQRVATVSRRQPEAGLVLPTIRREQPYIHLVRDGDGAITEILHVREGDPMPQAGESDMGLFVLSDRSYFDLLPQFAAEEIVGASTGERNFLPFIPWLTGRAAVKTVDGTDPMEAVGINTPDELNRIEEWLCRG